MIESWGRVVGTVAVRLRNVVADATGAIVRRYGGTRSGVDADLSVKAGADGGGADGIDGPKVSPGAGDAGTRAADPQWKLMSVDEFVERFHAADRSGKPELRTPSYMTSVRSRVELFVYPDGFEVLYKSDLTSKHQAAVLVSAVGRVIGAPVAPVVTAGEAGSVLMQRMPGWAICRRRQPVRP